MLPPERDLQRLLGEALAAEVQVAVADDPVDLQTLGAGELGRYAAIAGTPRAATWLRGRAALKRLLAAMDEATDTSMLGFPHPRVSLTHSGAYAVAVGARGHAGVGVDLELDRVPRAGAARFFLDEEERAAAGSPGELLRLWTVKEALFKADPGNLGHTLMDYRVANPRALLGVARAVHDATLRPRYATLRLPAGYLSAAVSCREARR